MSAGLVFTLGKFSGVREPGLTVIFPWQSMRRRRHAHQDGRYPPPGSDDQGQHSDAGQRCGVLQGDSAGRRHHQIEDHIFAVRQYTQAALRDIIGNSEMDFVLTERVRIAESIKEIVDAETSGWGVDVESIKVQEVELPAEMKRAMAKQAEAERERRAMIIASQGELTSSDNLRQAAETLARSPGALHLRTLQTIRDIAADPSEKIVLFMPSELGDLAARLASPSKGVIGQDARSPATLPAAGLQLRHGARPANLAAASPQ